MYKKLTEKIIELGGNSILKQSKVKSWEKSDSEWVTNIDIYNQKILVDEIRKLLPNEKLNWVIEEKLNGIERSLNTNGEDYHIFIDPIDGTTNYKSGGKEFAISVCIEKDKTPEYYCIYIPYEDLLVEFINNKLSIRQNGKDIDFKQIGSKNFQDLQIALHDNHQSHDIQERIYTQICNSQGKEFSWQKSGSNVRPGSIIKDLVELAIGINHDVLINGGTHLWDIAAVRHLLKSRNTEILDWSGDIIDIYQENNIDRDLKLVVGGEGIDEILKIISLS